MDEQPGELNSSQKLHLLTSCQYADKLLSEIESILTAATSKSPFPRYKPDISASQAKLVQDYIARIRAQMLRVLESQGITAPAPQFGSIHSIRVTLGFVDIAFDECRSKNMRGYGDVPETSIAELDGLVNEVQGIVGKLDAYLAQGEGQDLEERLRKLEQAGANTGIVQILVRIISKHGLVEFRSALSVIADRLSGDGFEIAVFGRVSSGKSSLLNHIVQSEVLPVGVTPITSVPTRLIYGSAVRGTAWFAGGNPEAFEISRLPEFVTEQLNPANARHVTRIVVEISSPRLRQGVILVDTPGLGSLASSGAAETKAYLPRCDLGIVLIDAGSTLSQDDLATIQALYDAGIAARVLLSKADLLGPGDRETIQRYIADHIQSELELNLLVHPVSIKEEHARLLEEWFKNEILPLYDRHAELARQSLNRKIGGLREAVVAALNAKLKHASNVGAGDFSHYRQLESALRKTAGKFAEVRSENDQAAHRLREVNDIALTEAGRALGEHWTSTTPKTKTAHEIVRNTLGQLAAEAASPIAAALANVAEQAETVLSKAAKDLGLQDAPVPGELSGVLKEMPRLDEGGISVDLRPNKLVIALGKASAVRFAQRQLRREIGRHVAIAFETYSRILYAWARKTLTNMQTRFDVYADTYRAQLDRLINANAMSEPEEQSIQHDLDELKAITADDVTVASS